MKMALTGGKPSSVKPGSLEAGDFHSVFQTYGGEEWLMGDDLDT